MKHRARELRTAERNKRVQDAIIHLLYTLSSDEALIQVTAAGIAPKVLQALAIQKRIDRRRGIKE